MSHFRVKPNIGKPYIPPMQAYEAPGESHVKPPGLALDAKILPAA